MTAGTVYRICLIVLPSVLIASVIAAACAPKSPATGQPGAANPAGESAQQQVGGAEATQLSTGGPEAKEADVEIVERTIEDLPIELRGTDDGSFDYLTDIDSVTITIRGPADVLNSARMQAFADATGMEAGTYGLRIRFDGLPLGAVVTDRSANLVTVTISEKPAD